MQKIYFKEKALCVMCVYLIWEDSSKKKKTVSRSEQSIYEKDLKMNWYLSALESRPLMTKCVTSSILLGYANFQSQKIQNVRKIKWDDVKMYGTYLGRNVEPK